MKKEKRVSNATANIRGHVDVFSFFLTGPSSSPCLTFGLGLGLGFGLSSSTSIASPPSSFFGLDLAFGLAGFFFGSSSASLPSAGALDFFLVSFFFPAFAALASSRSPLASDAVTPPPDSESLSLGDPASLDDARKSSSKRTT